jgi:hypothetical protein
MQHISIEELLTNPALSAFLRTMPAIAAVLARVTGIRTGARGGKEIEWDLVDEKNREYDLSDCR